MSTTEPTPNPIDERFNAGFEAAIESIRASLDGLQRVGDYSNHPATRGIDEEFIRETTEWAKREWPTLKDAVDERMHAQPVSRPELLMQGLTSLVLARLSTWLESPDIRVVLEDYRKAMYTIEFYSEQITKLLQGVGILTAEQMELPALAQGIFALQYLLGRVSELEGQAQLSNEAETLWAAAANMMNAALDGQPENDDTSLPLLDRFQTYLRRIGEQAWEWTQHNCGSQIIGRG